MSRSEAANYAQVVCECPHEHLLGTIIVKWDFARPHYLTSAGWHGRPMSPHTTQSSGDSITIGEKVKATCEGCTKQSRYGTDYQASWKRVAAKIAEARETRSERVTLVFE